MNISGVSHRHIIDVAHANYLDTIVSERLRLEVIAYQRVLGKLLKAAIAKPRQST